MNSAGGFTGNVRDEIARLTPPGIEPPTFYRANMDRSRGMSNASVLTTAVMSSVPVWFNAGEVVNTIRVASATTAANGPTNQWCAIYDPDGNLVDQTENLEDEAWAANTVKAFDFDDEVTIGQSGWHRVAICVTATTAVPTLVGATLHNAIVSGAWATGELPLSATSGSALTDTAPATIGTLTAIAGVPLVICS